VKVEQVNCTFTKENLAAKPDLMNTPEAQEAGTAEEYCEACGRVMVLKRGQFGMFMACPGYNEDPPCKTTRKLDQKMQQKAPQPTDEICPRCGKQLVIRNGQYGEFTSCSGYPKCKYIKQNLVEGMTCPKCGKGDIAERRTRFGTIFYGCTNYPKCDYTVNFKPVVQPCPECGSRYLLEKTLKSGTYLVCPNNRKPVSADDAAKKRKKKPEPEEEAPAVTCTFVKKIADPQPQVVPTAATHAPVLEQPVG
jgi:DNA topoisomerase-1